MIFLSTLLISVLVTIALIPFLRRTALRLHLVDVPNERKVHQQPIPRVGGLAMALGALLPIIFWQSGEPLVRAWLAGAGVLVIFGLADDFRELKPTAKFAGQIGAALIPILYGGVQIRSLGVLLPESLLLPVWLAVPLTLLVIVGVTNAINLADGLDGLAGGLSLMVFCCIGYLAYQEGDVAIGFIALALGGSIFGFLKFNTFPATVFMGDTGSQLLGYSSITLSLALTQGHTPLSPLLPLILLGFPIMDTLSVMRTRIAQGRSPFSADKNHFHHALLQLGFFHPESVLIIYIIQFLLVVAAYLLRFQSEWLLLGCYLLFTVIILKTLALADRTRQHWNRSGFYDTRIKEPLRRLRDSGVIIRPCFRIFGFGIPLLLLDACLQAGQAPGYVCASALVLAVVLAGTWFLDRARIASSLRLCIYLVIPFALYLGDVNPPAWLGETQLRAYNIVYGTCALFILVISKFTRREEGFKSTPLDFLIIFLVVVLLRVPDTTVPDFHLGLLAARIIVFFFSYELLISETRRDLGRMTLFTLAALLVLAFRSWG